MKRKIVLDSSSNLWQLPGVDYACVPLKIITDEQEYVDDPGTDAFAMAHTLRTYKGKSSTSCPNVGDFLAALLEAAVLFLIAMAGACALGLLAAKGLESILFTSVTADISLDVSLQFADIALLSGIGSAVVVIAVLVSLVSVIRANPKDILSRMEG